MSKARIYTCLKSLETLSVTRNLDVISKNGSPSLVCAEFEYVQRSRRTWVDPALRLLFIKLSLVPASKSGCL